MVTIYVNSWLTTFIVKLLLNYLPLSVFLFMHRRLYVFYAGQEMKWSFMEVSGNNHFTFYRTKHVTSYAWKGKRSHGVFEKLDVNAAILTKFKWKILTDADDVRVKVFSAKYFNKISSLEAKKYTKSSYYMERHSWAQRLDLKGVYAWPLVIVTY